MNKILNEVGSIHTLPLLLLITTIGIISFLLITFTAPLSGLLGTLNPKSASHAATTIGSWTNVTSNLAGMPSECGNLTMLSATPGSDTIIAGIAQRGLWASSNSGANWSNLGSGAGSAVITNRPSWISYDPNNSAIFYESGIYNGGGVYKTTNNGTTLTQLGTIGHIDYVSVDYTDPNRQTLVAGGHEASQKVYKSTNGGTTWTEIGGNLPAGTGFSSDPLALGPQTYIVNTYPSWGGGTPGIYRTTNGGASWTKVSSEPANQPPLVTANGTIYYSDGTGLVRSTDSGMTWTKVGSGLRAEARPIELPDGRLAAVGGTNLMISADGGSTWSAAGPNMPYTPAGLIYSLNRKAFFIWNWDCGGVVLSNAVEKLDFDFGLTSSSTPAPSVPPTPMSTPTATAQPTNVPTPTASPFPGNTTTIDDAITGTGLNQFNYVGTGWNHCGNCGADLYNGSNSWDNVAGNTVTVQFTGQQAAFYGVKDPSEGTGAFSVDNGPETIVDFFTTTRAGNQLIYTSPVLSSGTHTLKLRVTGTQTAGTNSYVSADRVVITTTATSSSSPTPTPTATPSSCPKKAMGDIDCDNTIGIFDYNILVGNFNKVGTGIQGDLDSSGKVDIFDYNTLSGNFGK